MSRIIKTKDGVHQFVVGNTTVGQLSAEGGAYSGDMARAQDIQDGEADKPAYKNTSFTADNGVRVEDNDTLSFTDGSGNDRPFSALVVAKVGTSTGATEVLFGKGANGWSTFEWALQRLATGVMSFRLFKSDGSANITGSASENPSNGWHTFVATYDGSESTNGMALYYDGMSKTLTGSATGSYTGMSNTIAPTNIGCIYQFPSFGWRNEFSRAALFNYVLPIEKIRRYSAGAKLDYADVGGSNTDLAASGTWTNNAFDIFTSSGNDITRAQKTLTGGSAYLDSFNQVVGKVYRVYFTATMLNSKTVYPRFQLTTSSNATNSNVVQSISTTTYVDLTCLVSDSAGHLYIDTTSADSDFSLTIHAVQQLGAVLDLEPEDISANQWTDQSGNELHGIPYACTPVNLPKYFNTEFGPTGTKQDIIDGAAGLPAVFVVGLNNPCGIDCGDSDQFTFGGGGVDKPMSFLFRGKYRSNASTRCMAKDDGNRNGEYIFTPVNGVSGFRAAFLSNSSNYIERDAIQPLPNNVWSTVGFSYDGSKASAGIKIYYDGIEQPTVDASLGTYTGMSNTSHPLRIGAANGATPFHWRDEFNRAILFNYAISAEKFRRYSAGAKLDYEDIGGSMTEKLANGTFDTDTVWVKGTGWSIGSGVATKVAGTASTLAQGVGIHGKRYRLTYTLTRTAGSIQPAGSGWALTTRTSSGTYTEEFVWTSTDSGLYFSADASFAGTIDNVSLIQLGAIVDLEPEGIGQGPGWLDSSGNNLHGTTYDCKLINVPAPVDSSNYAINGGFDFWQRGTSFTMGSGNYSADRWCMWDYGAGNRTVSRQTGERGDYCLRAQRNAGNATTTGIWVSQSMESLMSRPLAGKWLTLSVRARKGADFSGTFSVYITTGTGVDQNLHSGYTGGVIHVNTTATLTTSFQTFSYTFLVPSDAKEIGFEFGSGTFSGTAGANDYFEIEQVMLNVGPTPALFQRAGGDIASELALCQRYFRITAINARTLYYDANTLYFGYNFPSMRTGPALYTNSPAAGTDFEVHTVAGIAQSGFTVSAVSLAYADSVRFALSKTTHGLTDGTFTTYGTNKIGLSAEL